jgi:hypothetical protein
MKDLKLKEFLVKNGIENVENVRTVHLFGICWDDDSIIHHSINDFETLYEYIYEIDYQRIMVIYNNGGSEAWDIDPDLFREGLDIFENDNIVINQMNISPLVN